MERISHMDMTKPAIEMREIVKKFGDFTANDHVNLLVHKGEVHAILGENGAGKTTLIKLIEGLYRPTAGSILIDKMPIETFDGKSLRGSIATVMQKPVHYSFTIAENILLREVQNDTDRRLVQKVL